MLSLFAELILYLLHMVCCLNCQYVRMALKFYMFITSPISWVIGAHTKWTGKYHHVRYFCRAEEAKS